jgi:hypothetical protein
VLFDARNKIHFRLSVIVRIFFGISHTAHSAFIVVTVIDSGLWVLLFLRILKVPSSAFLTKGFRDSQFILENTGIAPSNRPRPFH